MAWRHNKSGQQQPWYWPASIVGTTILVPYHIVKVTAIQYIIFTNPRMHMSHIPQCSIQNRNVHISVLNGALWDMEQVHFGICELGQLKIKCQCNIRNLRAADLQRDLHMHWHLNWVAIVVLDNDKSILVQTVAWWLLGYKSLSDAALNEGMFIFIYLMLLIEINPQKNKWFFYMQHYFYALILIHSEHLIFFIKLQIFLSRKFLKMSFTMSDHVGMC